ncbi:peptidase inhibitor I36 [Saccharomonospora piscinae]|uniref:Peptidase inhibitor I36 n=1 Tax=Saccharomonospora piscinae TaxID=687388 RepID=A0A1V8ZXF0_SACPI|nr:peptidase inhibitor family I36 protein [Saccharomonospora piscinae]OQO89446.1 peptidase inhibitor I36 [Saccharomonospora piscinae]
MNHQSHRNSLGSRLRTAVLLAGLTLVLAPTAATAATAAESSPGEVRSSGQHACERGEFCLWSEQDYGGTLVRLDLRNTNPEQCREVPDGVEGRAFGNLLNRHVTVYQDGDCATEGDFSTYPGPGTFVPRSPYVVRAVKIWN